MGGYLTKLLLLLCAAIPSICVLGSSTGVFIKQYFLTLLYLLFVVLLWRSKFTRIFSILLLVLWVLNISASVIMWYLFGSTINVPLAMTTLSTNVNEGFDFVAGYWQVALIGVLFFIFMLWLIANLARSLSPKILKIASCIFILIVGYKFCESAFKGRLSDPSFLMVEKVASYTSLNNIAPFSRANNELELLSQVNKYQPNYQLTVIDKGIDTYVIVIGESARRNNMSLYGYARPTTPNLEAEKDNLYIFENAVAAAPITTMSVAKTLTAQAAESKELAVINDNIINLANQAGFTTYWFSKQGSIGRFETIVTSIAQNAQHKQWTSQGYDGVLLDYLDGALADADRKKLIVLHTNGSHLSACNQYPESDSYFQTGGEESYEDCYDNSIHYTDQLLEDIFSRLKDQNAAVLYFSDHGQHRRVKGSGEVDYIHGAINPYKEAVDVPQIIWFSPNLAPQYRVTGSLLSLYSLSDNYELIQDWLGIEQANSPNIHSPFNSDYQPRRDVLIMDTHEKVYSYNQLKSESE
ncbi:phosphoethanolamine transferase [Zophobihabitans entericus]|uniref:Phosphoethanolamine transferase n=1 Tax=Zophobihabitans entericus TaxID=1635327 RepID=A0A6G9I974_9GAMM|nr:phosphoethanolamine transferase [Zophobihabitans entericus]QIQ20771.1 phosphoethanolamine transferase [Zophobihabitans entericus]